MEFVMDIVAQGQVFLGVRQLCRGLLEDVRRVVIAFNMWLLTDEALSVLLCLQ